MFNLLPELEKKQIIDEYNSRRVAVALIFLFVVGIIGVISIFPSYVLSSLKISEVQNNIGVIRNSTIFQQEADLNKELSQANMKLLALHPPKNEVSVDFLLTEVISHKSPDIRINDLYYSGPAGSANLTVSGIARSREALSMFVDDLKKDPLFKNVNLPVSSFTKDQNADFHITITGAF